MNGLRLVIAGGRDFYNYNLLKRECDKFLSKHKSDLVEIVSGVAKGADSLGEKYAEDNEYNVKRFPANWDLYGRSAGFRRNEQMAKYATHAIMFWDGKSKGTKSMIDLCVSNGLKYTIVLYTHYSEIFNTDVIKLFKSGGYDLLAQGNNCFCVQGAGIAKEIVKNFPDALVQDRKTKKGDSNKLGTYYVAETFDDKKILGIYTQYDYGRDGKDRFQYDHFKNALEKINVEFAGKKILFSKIGGSLAGGNFQRIKQIILDTLIDMDITFCYY